MNNYSNYDYVFLHKSNNTDSSKNDSLIIINRYGDEGKKSAMIVSYNSSSSLNQDTCCNTIMKEFYYDGAKWILKSVDNLFCEDSFEYLLKDINDDSYNDLLIRNTTGEGRNITYYLYLYYPEIGSYIKIKDFETLPNINIESGYILSQAVSGNNDILNVYQIDFLNKKVKLYYKTGYPTDTIDSSERAHLSYLIDKYSLN